MNDVVVGEDRAGRPAAPAAGHGAGNRPLETKRWFEIGAELVTIRFGLLREAG